ncbi:MAG: hypothetical protein VYD19_04315 [Myxococcota bacterium]|nr:hypothetical protein [Myxococcota bacterium]
MPSLAQSTHHPVRSTTLTKSIRSTRSHARAIALFVALCTIWIALAIFGLERGPHGHPFGEFGIAAGQALSSIFGTVIFLPLTGFLMIAWRLWRREVPLFSLRELISYPLFLVLCAAQLTLAIPKGHLFAAPIGGTLISPLVELLVQHLGYASSQLLVSLGFVGSFLLTRPLEVKKKRESMSPLERSKVTQTVTEREPSPSRVMTRERLDEAPSAQTPKLDVISTPSSLPQSPLPRPPKAKGSSSEAPKPRSVDERESIVQPHFPAPSALNPSPVTPTLSGALSAEGYVGQIEEIGVGPAISRHRFRPAKREAIPPQLAHRVSARLGGEGRCITRIYRDEEQPEAWLIEYERPAPKYPDAKMLLEGLVRPERARGLKVSLGWNWDGRELCFPLDQLQSALFIGDQSTPRIFGLHQVVLNLLYLASPKEMRFIVAQGDEQDETFAALPHLYAPLLTRAKEIDRLLLWFAEELLRRQRHGAADQPRLLFLFPDLEMLSEAQQLRLAQLSELLSRVGASARCHLLLATRDPRTLNSRLSRHADARFLLPMESQLANELFPELGLDALSSPYEMLFVNGLGRMRRLHGWHLKLSVFRGLLKGLCAHAHPDYIVPEGNFPVGERSGR